MSGGVIRIIRLRKIKQSLITIAHSRFTTTCTSRDSTTITLGSPSSPINHRFNYMGRSCNPQRMQERYKWDGGSGSSDESSSTRKIRAEANCPRCSKQMDLLFSNRGDRDKGYYQAINLCPTCKTAYYFRPHKLLPLQGTFAEIGRIKPPPTHSDKNNPVTNSTEDDFSNRLRLYIQKGRSPLVMSTTGVTEMSLQQIQPTPPNFPPFLVAQL